MTIPHDHLATAEIYIRAATVAANKDESVAGMEALLDAPLPSAWTSTPEAYRASVADTVARMKDGYVRYYFGGDSGGLPSGWRMDPEDWDPSDNPQEMIARAEAHLTFARIGFDRIARGESP